MEATDLRPKNRYANAPKNADYTIDQSWASYSPQEHARWDRLSARQRKILPGRACETFLSAIDRLALSEGGIPNMEKLSDTLEPLTGWRVVPVADLVPDEVFFDHLANRRFPAGAFIRPEAEFDYLQEPDIFHDIFGHVPLLADPVFAEFMEAYGKGGQRAMELGQLPNLARLYWYTVEFGLIRNGAPSGKDLRIYGAGILSSPLESVFSLEDASPNRVMLDVQRVMRTNYIIDDFQQTYFVIDSFEELLERCYADFADSYSAVKGASEYEAHEIAAADEVLNRGTRAFFKNKQGHSAAA